MVKTKSFWFAWSGKYWISLSIKLMSSLSVIQFTTHACRAQAQLAQTCARKKSDWSFAAAEEKFFLPAESPQSTCIHCANRGGFCGARGKIMGDIPGLLRCKLISRCAFPSLFLSPSVRGGETLGRARCLGGERVKIHERRVWKTMKSWAREWFIRSPLIILCPPE